MEKNNTNTTLKPMNQVSNNSSYALNGKIMLCSIIILFTALSIMVFFHSFARWILNRNLRRRASDHRQQRLLSIQTLSSSSTGLDHSVLKALPTLVYVSDNKGEDDKSKLECSVCLSEFEDKEEGRVLPKCKHIFHLKCIDTWFGSHSTCPLCRVPVQLETNKTKRVG